MSVAEYAAVKKDALKNGVQLHAVDVEGRLKLAFVGPSGELFSTAREAGMSKALQPPAAKQEGLPLPGGRRIESDGTLAPGAPAVLPKGVRTLDARGLLATPRAAVGPNTFDPKE